MNEIIRHIEYLLVTNDCVVIPGFGAVIAHDMPSRFDRGHHVFMPPSRTFSFNSSLTHNDGLLVASIARSKSISFESSRNMVSREVEAMKRKLTETGKISLGLVGTLISDENGILSFEPGRTAATLSPKYLWLPELTFSPITELARKNAQAEALAAMTTERISPVNYLYRAFKVAASFVLLLALGFVLTTPINFEKAQYASLGLENFSVSQSNESAKTSKIIRRPGESSGVVKLYLREFDDAVFAVDTAAHAAYVRERQLARASESIAVSQNQVSDLRMDDNDRYFLIIASLTSESDAKKYIDNSNNQNLGILSKDGRHRVYAATGSTLREAQSAAAALSGRYPNVWVCRK